jgi:mannosyl-oligosaccharide alpha-1,2-mannosidase
MHLLSFALVIPHVVALVQKSGLTLPASAQANKAAVVKIFTESYAAYQEFAWGHDDLTPVSKSFTDVRNGWGATIVDALGTLVVMGLTVSLLFSSFVL